MSRTDGLTPFKKGEERAKVAGRKGGKTVTTARCLAQRKWCNSKCQLYPCFAQPLSISKFKGKCALKEFPLRIQRRTIDLSLKGKEGFGHQIIELLCRLSAKTDVSDDPKEIRSLIYDVINVYRTLYGNKTILEGEVKTDFFGTLSKIYEKKKVEK